MCLNSNQEFSKVVTTRSVPRNEKAFNCRNFPGLTIFEMPPNSVGSTKPESSDSEWKPIREFHRAAKTIASKTIVSKLDTPNTIASVEMLHTIDVPILETHTSAGRSPAAD